MFAFIRNFLALLAFLAILTMSAAYTAYGTVDPCHMLAKQRSAETIAGVSEAFGGDGSSLGVWDEVIESTYMALTNHLSTEECGQRLVHGWWDRITDLG